MYLIVLLFENKGLRRKECMHVPARKAVSYLRVVHDFVQAQDVGMVHFLHDGDLPLDAVHESLFLPHLWVNRQARRRAGGTGYGSGGRSEALFVTTTQSTQHTKRVETM